jgi:small-conductance mechanosensitive channel
LREKKMPKLSLVRAKMQEWSLRYLPSEFLAIVAAYTGYYYVWLPSQNILLASYCAAMAEIIAFYTVMFTRENITRWRQAKIQHKTYGAHEMFHVSAGLIMEFGFSELVDGFFIRPLIVSFAISMCGSSWGILLGKLTADITFYIPVIILYELRKHARTPRLEQRKNR